MLMRDELDRAEQLVLEEHLENCIACAEDLSNHPDEWIVAPGRERGEPRRVGSPTWGMFGRLIKDLHQGPSLRASADAASGFAAAPPIEGFRDLVEIGRGGMGVVYRAIEIELDRVVAIKVLRSRAGGSDTSRRRFLREARSMARLRHPHIVAIHGWGEYEETPYIVMEWVAGGTLQSRLERDRFDPKHTAWMLRDLARGLAEAHSRGIIHRDLKPANILIESNEEPAARPVAKIADFGLARDWESDDRVTETGLILGTPEFMAPEQTGLFPDFIEVGPPCDIHSLGAIGYAMLSGRAPYSGESKWATLVQIARGEPDPLRRIVAGLPRDLETIIERCLQRDPARRYRSAGELADDLDRFLEGRPVAARPPGRAERLLMFARRRPAAAAAAAAAVVLVALGIAGAGYHVKQLELANTRLQNERNRARDESLRADQERSRAEKALRAVEGEAARAARARDHARNALDNLTGDTVQRLLERGRPSDLNDVHFLERVSKLFTEFPDHEPTPENAQFRVQGLLRVARACFAFQLMGLGLTQLDQARQILDEAILRHPDDFPLHSARLGLLKLRFTELSDFGDVEGAARVARDALGLARKLPAISNQERDLILSDALERLGIALSNRSPGGEGEALLVEAVERIEAAAAASPDPAGLAPSLHRLHFNLALARLTGGKRDEALAGFEKVDAWLRDPRNSGDDGGSMAELRVLTKQKLVELRHPGATEESRFRDLLELEALARHAAESSSFQRGQSQRWFQVMESVAASARRLGRIGEGEAVLRRGLERYRTLSIGAPANFSYIETEARISILLIRFLEDQPSPLEAIQVGINALNRLYYWVAQDRTLATARSLFADLAGLTARLEGERLGNYKDAVAHLATAIGTLHGPPVQNLVELRREYQFRIRHAAGDPEAILEYVDRIRSTAKTSAAR